MTGHDTLSTERIARRNFEPDHKKGERLAPLSREYNTSSLIPDGTGLSPAVSTRDFKRQAAGKLKPLVVASNDLRAGAGAHSIYRPASNLHRPKNVAAQ